MKPNTSPIAWFEIVVKDFERAVAFYEAAFDVQLHKEQCGSSQMAIFPYQEGFPGGGLVEGNETQSTGAGGSIIYLTADAIGRMLARIEKQGGTTIMPCTHIGENGYIASFCDSEANIIGLWAPEA